MRARIYIGKQGKYVSYVSYVSLGLDTQDTQDTWFFGITIIYILFNFSVVELAKPEYATIYHRVPLHGTEEPLHEAEEPLHGTEKGVQSYPVYFKGQESESVPFLY